MIRISVRATGLGLGLGLGSRFYNRESTVGSCLHYNGQGNRVIVRVTGLWLGSGLELVSHNTLNLTQNQER
jgi:hypothetical protein